MKKEGKKNQKHILVPAGRWEITNFSYGNRHCMCCGRKIKRIIHLRNADHAAKVQVDPTYKHPEKIFVGTTCGPKIFMESTRGFYEDPEREWNRQYAAFKDFIEYVILCTTKKKLWEIIPFEVRNIVDKFLEEGYKEHSHSGPWWLVKDAKKKFLKARKNNKYSLMIRAKAIISAAKRLHILDQSYILPELVIPDDI